MAAFFVASLLSITPALAIDPVGQPAGMWIHQTLMSDEFDNTTSAPINPAAARWRNASPLLPHAPNDTATWVSGNALVQVADYLRITTVSSTSSGGLTSRPGNETNPGVMVLQMPAYVEVRARFTMNGTSVANNPVAGLTWQSNTGSGYSSGKWQKEIDIVRLVGANNRSIFRDYHWWGSSVFTANTTPNNWHVYGMKLTTAGINGGSEIHLYVDGVLKDTITENANINKSQLYFFLANSVLGTNPKFPAYADYDYVRTWSCAGSPASCS